MKDLGFDVLLITDEGACRSRGRTVVETVTRALAAVDASRVAVLVRYKRGSKDDVKALCRALIRPVTESGGYLLVHTHADIARELSLAGAHLSSGIDGSSARAFVDGDMVLGASRHGADALDQSDIGRFDYTTVSPVFPPTSKQKDERPPMQVEGLQLAVQRSVRPVVALGGITPARAMLCKSAGAAGVGVLGGVMGAEDPGAELAAILDTLG